MQFFLIALYFLVCLPGIALSDTYKNLKGKFLYVEISKNTYANAWPLLNNWVNIFNSREECHNHILNSMLDSEQLHRLTTQSPDGTKSFELYSASEKGGVHFYRQCIDINVSN